MNTRASWKEIAGYSTIGLEIALSVLFGLLGGRWLDRKLDAGGWLTFLGLAFGIAAGVRTLLRATKRMNRQAEAEERREREARSEFHDDER